MDYLKIEKLLDDPREVRKLRRKALRFFLFTEKFYKRGYVDPLLKYVIRKKQTISFYKFTKEIVAHM